MEIQLSAVKQIENRAKQLPGAISLAQGTPSLSSHPLIRDAVIQALTANKVDKYSPVTGLPELRQLFCQKLQLDCSAYDPETEVIVTAGALQALSASLLALFQSGDEIIMLTPCYPYYEKIIRMAKARPIAVPLREDQNWKLDVNQLKQKITKRTKAVLICSPNNPTGSVLTEKELLALGALAQKHNFLLILDDIYQNFYYGQKPLYTLHTQPQFKKHLLRIVSLSKDFALSGWRIGFLHGDKEHICKIIPYHDNLINCAPVISQYAAIAALTHEQTIIPAYQQIYKQRRQLMGSYLESLKGYMNFVWPEGTYYFFPKILGVSDSTKLCFDILEKAKVALVPGIDFGLGGESHVRLCFGKSVTEIREGIKRLAHYFTSNSL